MEKDSTTRIRYIFRFLEGTEKVFEVVLNLQTGALLQKKRVSYPSWTNLEHCRCKHCPLNRAEHPQCPVAVSIIDVVDFFSGLSIDQAG